MIDKPATHATHPAEAFVECNVAADLIYIATRKSLFIDSGYEMNMSQYIRGLYSLDTLDTRFTASKSSPLKELGAGQQTTRAAGAAGETTRSSRISASLWPTKEFYIYYAMFIVIVPLMFKVAIEVSNREFNEMFWINYSFH